MILRLLILLFSTLLLLACSNGFEDNPSIQNISIAHLKSLCNGDHYRIVNDYIVRGVVVTTDWLGEMVQSAVIVDRSGGLEIAIDSHNVGNLLPIYSEVEVLCNGLMLARIGGKIEMGAPSTGNFPLANIDEEMVGRYIRIVGTNANFKPITKRFAEIGTADISAIVRFDNVRICKEEEGLLWCDIVDGEAVTTFRTFVDAQGERFALRTLPTCNYARERIPTKEVSVVGVIDYSDNRYFLRLVNKGII